MNTMQSEVRIIAAIAKQESMVKAMLDGLDVHAVNAAAMYRTTLDKVTSLERQSAKLKLIA